VRAFAAVLATLVMAPICAPRVPAEATPPTCQQAPSPGVPIPPQAPRDPLIAQLGLDQAWTLSTGSGVTVGVVDSGVDPASAKLAGAVDVGQTYRATTTSSVYARAADGRVDCDGHGTEIAGIIAGRTHAGDDRVSGIAPSARIYPVAIEGEIAQAPAALLAAAIRDAADHGSVLNLSFATPTNSPEIAAAIGYALSRDVVVVAAAANETGTGPNGGAATWYPAAYPGVLAVADVAADGAPQENGARGAWISLAAPGESLTTESRGGHGYVTVTGTSFATAIVSGAAALVRARFPSLSAAAVIARLERTAVPPGDGSRDPAIGYGIVDPFAALTAPLGAVPALSSARQAALPVPPIRHAAGRDSSAGVLELTAVLIAIALVLSLARLSMRSGQRRGWHPGALPPERADARVADPHPAELG
jgi:type VII secretion-associated serine protease mycosin